MPTAASLQETAVLPELGRPNGCSPRTELQQRDLDEFPHDRRLVKSVNFQRICRFTDYSAANGDLSQSKWLTHAVFLQRSLARIVHYDTWG
jgi:hypothetical protein